MTTGRKTLHMHIRILIIHIQLKANNIFLKRNGTFPVKHFNLIIRCPRAIIKQKVSTSKMHILEAINVIRDTTVSPPVLIATSNFCLYVYRARKSAHTHTHLTALCGGGLQNVFEDNCRRHN